MHTDWFAAYTSRMFVYVWLFPPLLVITCDYLCQHFCFKTYPIALPALIHTLYMYLYQDECSPSTMSFYKTCRLLAGDEKPSTRCQKARTITTSNRLHHLKLHLLSLILLKIGFYDKTFLWSYKMEDYKKQITHKMALF